MRKSITYTSVRYSDCFAIDPRRLENGKGCHPWPAATVEGGSLAPVPPWDSWNTADSSGRRKTYMVGSPNRETEDLEIPVGAGGGK